jgi:hypothetical protein
MGISLLLESTNPLKSPFCWAVVGKLIAVGVEAE